MPYIASMGIYMIKAEVVKQLLENDFPDANDFGGEVIPGAKERGMHVQAFLFDGYWEDIGTVGAFYNANLQVTQPNAPFRHRLSPSLLQSTNLLLMLLVSRMKRCLCTPI